MGELAVALADVEAVAHYEVGRDLEAYVAQVEVFVLAALPYEQGAHFETGGVAGLEVLAEVVEGQAAVDDVFHQDHVSAGEVEVEVFDDPHHAAGSGGAAVRRHGHEVELHRQLDGPGQIGHEHEGALQHPHQQGSLASVVGGDSGAEVGDAGRQLVVGYQDRAGTAVVAACLGRHGVNLVVPTCSGRAVGRIE